MVLEARLDYGKMLRSLLKIRSELDEVIETLEVLSDKKLVEGIKESLEEAKRGEGVPLEEILKRFEDIGQCETENRE